MATLVGMLAKLGLDASDFSKGLSTAQQAMDVASGGLSKSVGAASSAFSGLRGNAEQMSTQVQALQARYDRLTASVAVQEEAYKKLAASGKATEAVLNQKRIILEQNKQALEANAQKINDMRQKLAALNTATQPAAAGIKGVGDQSSQAASSVERVKKAASDTQSSLSQISRTAQSAGTAMHQMSAGAMAGAIALGNLAAAGIQKAGGALMGMARTAFDAYASNERLGMSLESLIAKELKNGSMVTEVVGATRVKQELTAKEVGMLADLQEKYERLNASIPVQAEALQKLTASGKASAAAINQKRVALEQDKRELQELGGQLAALNAKNGTFVTIQQTATRYTLDQAAALEKAKGPARELQDWIQKLAIQSPFEQADVAAAIKQAMAYGFTSKAAQELTANLIDFASATGASGGVMQQVANAMGQIQAKGRLMGGEVLQLVNAGIDVQGILKGMGFSLEDVEKGTIKADKFLEAFNKTISTDFGGAAKRQASAMSGLVSTFSDLKNVGLREFFTGTFQAMQPFLAGALDKIATPETFARLNAIGMVVGQTVGGAFSALGGIVQMAQGQMRGGLEGISGGLLQMGLSVVQIQPLTAVLIRIPAVIAQITAVAGPFVAQLLGMRSQVNGLKFDVFLQALGAIRQNMPLILQTISTVLTAIQGIWGAVWPNLVRIVQAALPVVFQVIQAAMPIIQQVAAFIQQVISQLAPVITKFVLEAVALIQANLPLIQSIIQNALTLIKAIWDLVWPYLQIVLEGVWNAIKIIVVGALNILNGVINAALAAVQGDWGEAWEQIKGVGETVWNTIQSLLANFLGTIAATLRGQVTNFEKLGRDLWMGAYKGIEGAVMATIDAVKNWVNELISAAKSAAGIHSPSKEMIDFALNLARGLIAGLKESEPDVAKAGAEILDALGRGLSSIVGAAGAIGSMTALPNLSPFAEWLRTGLMPLVTALNEVGGTPGSDVAGALVHAKDVANVIEELFSGLPTDMGAFSLPETPVDFTAWAATFEGAVIAIGDVVNNLMGGMGEKGLATIAEYMGFLREIMTVANVNLAAIKLPEKAPDFIAWGDMLESAVIAIGDVINNLIGGMGEKGIEKLAPLAEKVRGILDMAGVSLSGISAPKGLTKAALDLWGQVVVGAGEMIGRVVDYLDKKLGGKDAIKKLSETIGLLKGVFDLASVKLDTIGVPKGLTSVSLELWGQAMAGVGEMIPRIVDYVTAKIGAARLEKLSEQVGQLAGMFQMVNTDLENIQAPSFTAGTLELWGQAMVGVLLMIHRVIQAVMGRLGQEALDQASRAAEVIASMTEAMARISEAITVGWEQGGIDVGILVEMVAEMRAAEAAINSLGTNFEPSGMNARLPATGGGETGEGKRPFILNIFLPDGGLAGTLSGEMDDAEAQNVRIGDLMGATT